MAIDNSFVAVEGYATKEFIPDFQAKLTYVDLVDRYYEGWETVVTDGTRGPSFKYQLPSRFRVQEDLSQDFSNSSTTEREGFIVVNRPLSVGTAFLDEELTVFPYEKMMERFGDDMSTHLAEAIDKVVRDALQFSGNRFFGRKSVPIDTNATMGKIRQSVTKFTSFGLPGQSTVAKMILPSIALPSITNTSLVEFTPAKNELAAKSWSLGSVKGFSKVDFYETNLIETFVVGTVAAKAPLAEIISVVDSTTAVQGTLASTRFASTITLTGLTDADVVKVGELGDIGSLEGQNGVAIGLSALKLLRPVGFIPTTNDAQFIVTEAGTVGATTPGEVTFTVIPRMKALAPIITDATISRAIVTGVGGDKVQFVNKDHLRGSIFWPKYIKFANPKLNSKNPYPTYIQQPSEMMKTSVRVYHGSLLDKNVTGMGHDAFVGSVGEGEGIGQMLFNPNVGDSLI